MTLPSFVGANSAAGPSGSISVPGGAADGDLLVFLGSTTIESLPTGWSAFGREGHKTMAGETSVAFELLGGAPTIAVLAAFHPPTGYLISGNGDSQSRVVGTSNDEAAGNVTPEGYPAGTAHYGAYERQYAGHPHISLVLLSYVSAASAYGYNNDLGMAWVSRDFVGGLTLYGSGTVQASGTEGSESSDIGPNGQDIGKVLWWVLATRTWDPSIDNQPFPGSESADSWGADISASYQRFYTPPIFGIHPPPQYVTGAGILPGTHLDPDSVYRGVSTGFNPRLSLGQVHVYPEIEPSGGDLYGWGIIVAPIP